MDETFADGQMRWIEVAPKGAPTAIALAPPMEGNPTSVDSGIIISTDDIEADHAALKDAGVDVDPEIARWGPPVPPMIPGCATRAGTRCRLSSRCRASRRPSADEPKESPNLLDKQIRLLEGGEVPASVGLVPVADVEEALLRPSSRRALELLGEDRAAGGNVDRVGRAAPEIHSFTLPEALPVEAGWRRRRCGVASRA